MAECDGKIVGVESRANDNDQSYNVIQYLGTVVAVKNSLNATQQQKIIPLNTVLMRPKRMPLIMRLVSL
jgi:hypothetical protein